MNINTYYVVLALFFASLLGCDTQTKESDSLKSATNTEQERQKTTNDSEQFASLLAQYYQDKLKLNPVEATFTGDKRYNASFVNHLDDQVKQNIRKMLLDYQQQLTAISDVNFSEQEKLSKVVLEWELAMGLQGLSFSSDYTPINQMWTVNLMMGQFASGKSAQPFHTVSDYQQWLTRVDEYLLWLQSAKEKMQQGIQVNYVLPKSLVKKVIPQFAKIANTPLVENLFYTPITSLPESFSQKNKALLTKAYQNMVEEKIKPAYQDMANFLKNTYLPAARESSGIDAVKNGEDFYQYQIKLYTTTDLSAEEIHQLGLNEVARIRKQMEAVKVEVGFNGDLKAFFHHVRNNKALMPFTEPAQIIDFYKATHQKMKPQLEKLFDQKPKTAFEVRRTEAFREKSASAEYNQGSLDGTRPGIFYTPIPDASQYNIYDAESLFLHEAIPGHHYQISLTQENQSLPDFRKTLWYSGYGEGWALYTESLGKELGLYDDPYQYFGMLSAEMHRAIRLVVDTGLHAKGWTREKAIAYSLDNEAESEASIEREIERYMANPAQALSYKIGQITIQKLRKMAEVTLAEKFDIKAFHNQVLSTGPIPLALLEEKIQGWVKEQQ